MAARVEADLVLGRHGEVVGELQALVARHPLQEELHRQLMVSLYRCGRQAEALQAYQPVQQALTGRFDHACVALAGMGGPNVRSARGRVAAIGTLWRG